MSEEEKLLREIIFRSWDNEPADHLEAAIDKAVLHLGLIKLNAAYLVRKEMLEAEDLALQENEDEN